jgi:succinate-semialdehyde dehydrogenase/glutarate-semialdehyde dehydrogenase
MKKLVVGDPLDPSTEVGPMARPDLRDALHDQVLDALEQRATLLCGGDRVARAGFFYQPTVLSGVKATMRVFAEETFGPVAAMIRADNARHAIALANHSVYGLGASLWTRDLDHARQLVGTIAAGSVFVNSMVVSDPRLPFGGIRESGYGRELGAHGIREFTNVKTISIA